MKALTLEKSNILPQAVLTEPRTVETDNTSLILLNMPSGLNISTQDRRSRSICLVVCEGVRKFFKEKAHPWQQHSCNIILFTFSGPTPL